MNMSLNFENLGLGFSGTNFRNSMGMGRNKGRVVNAMGSIVSMASSMVSSIGPNEVLNSMVFDSENNKQGGKY